MKFGISQFTLDPNNFVNISIFIKKEIARLVNSEIFKKIKTDEKFKNWHCVYIISSHSSYAKRGHVNLNPSRSFKYKAIEYYVYFPKFSKQQNYKYNKKKFVKFFFEGLKKILSEFNFNDNELLEKCLQYSITQIITDRRSDYEEQGVYLSKKQITQILRSK